MGCILTLLALVVPRVVMVFIVLLTNWFSQAYHTILWPLLGFFFMPYTTLAYMAAMLNNAGNVSGGWLVLVIVAAIVDIGHWGGSRRTVRTYRVRRVRRSRA
ncbi:MAG: hypothetical protein ACOCZU_02160 [Planctomycetota bacterium]